MVSRKGPSSSKNANAKWKRKAPDDAFDCPWNSAGNAFIHFYFLPELRIGKMSIWQVQTSALFSPRQQHPIFNNEVMVSSILWFRRSLVQEYPLRDIIIFEQPHVSSIHFRKRHHLKNCNCFELSRHCALLNFSIETFPHGFGPHRSRPSINQRYKVQAEEEYW